MYAFLLSQLLQSKHVRAVSNIFLPPLYSQPSSVFNTRTPSTSFIKKIPSARQVYYVEIPLAWLDPKPLDIQMFNHSHLTHGHTHAQHTQPSSYKQNNRNELPSTLYTQILLAIVQLI